LGILRAEKLGGVGQVPDISPPTGGSWLLTRPGSAVITGHGLRESTSSENSGRSGGLRVSAGETDGITIGVRCGLRVSSLGCAIGITSAGGLGGMRGALNCAILASDEIL